MNHSLQIKDKASDCFYARSFQLQFWRCPLDFDIYSALRIWSLDNHRTLSYFFTLFTNLDAPSNRRRLLFSVKAALCADADVFNFNQNPLCKQKFLKAAVLYGLLHWELQTAEQVGKPCFCGKDQEKWVFPNLCTPRWLRSLRNTKNRAVQNLLFFFLLLDVVSLPGNKLVKVGDFVYTPEVQEDGNSRSYILPEMFKDMQLTQWASDCKTDSSRPQSCCIKLSTST